MVRRNLLAQLPGQFYGPEGVAIDGDGNIVVADYSNHRIQKFSSTGKFIKAIEGKGGKGPQHFN